MKQRDCSGDDEREREGKRKRERRRQSDRRREGWKETDIERQMKREDQMGEERRERQRQREGERGRELELQLPGRPLVSHWVSIKRGPGLIVMMAEFNYFHPAPVVKHADK